jgi:hypothetical protein
LLARGTAVVYLLAAMAWVASLMFRLVVTPEAASAFVTRGSLDPTYS